jgi:hypothetical protein
VDRAFLLDPLPLWVLLSGFLVLGTHIDALDHDPIPLSQNLEDSACATLVVAGDYDHLVSGVDVHQMTSWARDTIFM